MDELRLQSADGERLVLESQDGTRFQLQIDDSLRSALRNSSNLTNASISLSPREIQSAVRSGRSVEQIITQSGDPRDYIEKFAQPVLDELSHVLNSALSVRISIAGDRYSEVSQTGFGEIISSRLHASGIQDFAWSAFKDENSSWMIVAKYNLGGAANSASWSYDIKKSLLAPENEAAVTLSTQNSLVNQVKLAPVEVQPEPPQPQNITAALPDTQVLDSVIPIGRSSERSMVEKPALPAADLSKSKDLLDALKKKREERVANETSPTQTIEIVASELSEPIAGTTQEDLPAPNPSPIRRTGRPSIPSFEEIVQGTKSEDE